MSGKVSGEPERIFRSGLTDSRLRFAVDLKGAPAMNLKEFVGYRQKTNIGARVIVQLPTGQYDSAKLVSFLWTC